MNRKIIKFTTLALLISVIFTVGFFGIQKIWKANYVLGQENNSNPEIKQLNNEIQTKKERMKKIQEQQEAYKKSITQKQTEKASLVNQLAILENRLAKAELDIESVEIDIDRSNLEVEKVNLSIKDKNNQIIKEKEHIGSVLRLIHMQDSKTALEIMLLNNSFADFVNQVKYLEDINSEIGESLDNLKDYKNELEKQKVNLDEKKQKLNELKKELEDKKTILVSEQENKAFILVQTKESEKRYQKLLTQAKQEQNQAAADIVNLEKVVRAKINKMEDKKLEFNDNGLIWPVPKNVITAYFHDPDYPFRYLFEHPGIDIRARHGTTLKTAASGYVARVKLNKTSSYGYIMIVHGDGLSTVYGHISKAYVKEDEYVVQGQAIGLTGGMPGTPGSGRLTTGPHLHFEVRLNGIPVNPLEYLSY